MSQTAMEVAAQEERPADAFRTQEFRTVRPQIVGPDYPEPPFPIRLAGLVQRGFGRGGKDLGCPTGILFTSGVNVDDNLLFGFLANLPDDSITPMTSVAKTGVYYGYAQVLPPKDGQSSFASEDSRVLPMVMSLGWNPFYKNEQLTAVSTLFSQ